MLNFASARQHGCMAVCIDERAVLLRVDRVGCC
jgi:hypothetical protein